MIPRTIYAELWKELSSQKEMVFLTGPRQVGKTTLAKEMALSFTNNLYYNWDIIENKKQLIEEPTFFQNINRIDESKPLIIFDEIHKYQNWKNYLKGIYDQFKDDYIFLVSGSGRLDVYQKGGDSLAGRYFLFRLFPFTIAELSPHKRNIEQVLKEPLKGFDLNDIEQTEKKWKMLFNYGGFPEPFTKATETFYTRWSNNYHRQVIREDIRNFAQIKKIDAIETLFSLLPRKVGNPLSINNLAEDIQISFDSVKNWLRLFESLYLIFRIAPWTKKINRAILKEKKLYLFNYPFIQESGARFENMVALELMRAIANWNDYGFGSFGLHYIRNKEKEEVDFLIANNQKPFLLLEAKFSEDSTAKSLLSLQNTLHVPAVQLVNKKGVFKYLKNGKENLLIVSASRWLSSLP
ncbi:MAG: ATP-binding protein [Candidatus Omnitrophica bacterium]|nr:ATP-binding protein [Candidatus Omnitrophota bacterium]